MGVDQNSGNKLLVYVIFDAPIQLMLESEKMKGGIKRIQKGRKVIHLNPNGLKNGKGLNEPTTGPTK